MIYDFNTKNESFIELAYQLKQEGIKNYKFFLILIDEDLVGIDPYDKNLSDTMKLKIQKEIMNNYWYYIREIVKIPEPGGYTFYKINKLNLAISFCMEMNLNCFIEGPRQSGKTVGINIRYTWMYNYGTVNSQMAFSNKKLSDSVLNLKRFKEMVDLLPDYIKTHIDESLDRNNLDYIQSYANKNSIQALSAPNSLSAAEGLGEPKILN